MSTSVPCPGCTRAIMVMTDDPRSEIRCPACGFRFERPAPVGAITTKPRSRPTATVVTCAHCGETLRAADDRPVRCPVCGNPLDRITAQPPRPRPKRSEQIQRASTDIVAGAGRPAAADDDEDGAYGFAEPIRHCEHCDRELAIDTVVCLACGYNHETREVMVREYALVERAWDGALSYRQRLQIFAAAEAFALLMLVGSLLGDVVVLGVFVWLSFTLLLAYVLGTFYRLAVSRTPGGQVTVTKSWRVAFVPLRPTAVQLGRYEGVRTGKVLDDVDVWDWGLLLILLAYGGLPGLAWWWFAFSREEFYVGLLQDHGSVALELYRGWSEATAHEIAKVIRDVGAYRS